MFHPTDDDEQNANLWESQKIYVINKYYNNL